MKEFNLELNFVSRILRTLFIWSAILWTIVFTYRQLDNKYELKSKFNNLKKKLIKGLQIRVDEKEFKKIN